MLQTVLEDKSSDSPRGQVLVLDDPRGQFLMVLVLALRVESLSLALAS